MNTELIPLLTDLKRLVVSLCIQRRPQYYVKIALCIILFPIPGVLYGQMILRLILRPLQMQHA